MTRLAEDDSFPDGDSRPAVTPAVWAVRIAFVIAGLAAWFATQEMIGRRDDPPDVIGDGLLELTAPLHAYLTEHSDRADALLIVSSAIIDLMGIFLLARAVFGPTFRPFLALLIVFSLRQICQGLCALPPPEGMIWRDPGFPSLLVTYGVSNDLFFSGHTAIAVLGAVELARSRSRLLILLGVAIALFEVAAVLVLRAHWTMDIFAGAVTAVLTAIAADWLAPYFDRAVNRLLGRA